jgi:hypothetical protein
MAIVLSDIGADAILGAYFNNVWPSVTKDLTLKLYTNDKIPTDTDIYSDYTVAAGGGYVDKTLANGSWVVSAGNDPSDAVYAEQTWTFTGVLTTNLTIYGYYLLNHDNVLIYAEKFSNSYTPAKNGDQLKITPKFQLSKGTPS